MSTKVTAAFAGITTYNPDIERLAANLGAVIPQIDRVIIVDNGSSNLGSIRLLAERYGGKVDVRPNGTNFGVARALNLMVEDAVAHGNGWVLLLDQDSVCGEDMVAKLLGHVSKEVAIVCPLIADRNRERRQESNGLPVEEYDWPITSGTLLNIEACVGLGGFAESLFIDFVDDEYSLRARLAGYKILRVNDAVLIHEIGKLRPVGIPFPHLEGGCIVMRRALDKGHSPKRHYYQVRNLAALRREYGEACRSEGIVLPSFWKFILHSLLFEPNKRENLRMMMLGLKDASSITFGATKACFAGKGPLGLSAEEGL